MLDAYEAALERRDLAAMKRVWPGMDRTQEAGLRSDFQNARSIDVEIVNPQITVKDDTATVRFLRRYDFHTVDGQRLTSQSNTTMTLQRAGSGWTITQIRYVPIR